MTPNSRAQNIMHHHPTPKDRRSPTKKLTLSEYNNRAATTTAAARHQFKRCLTQLLLLCGFVTTLGISFAYNVLQLDAILPPGKDYKSMDGLLRGGGGGGEGEEIFSEGSYNSAEWDPEVASNDEGSIVEDDGNDEEFPEEKGPTAHLEESKKVETNDSSTFDKGGKAKAEEKEATNGNKEWKDTTKVDRRLMMLDVFNDPKSVQRKMRSIENGQTDGVVASSAPQTDKESNELPTTALLNEPTLSVKPYSLQTALSAFDVYDGGVALFVYDPKSDKFNVLYPKGTAWEESRFVRIRTWMFNTLRVMFPDRFTPDSPEFVVPIASMDYPQVQDRENDCFMNDESKPCVPEDFPPILQFGSVFKLPKIPSTIAMPMPEKNHLGCFHHWLHEHEVCKLYKEKHPINPNGLVFGETIGKTSWDDLIPQVVWRATDRGFLTRLLPDLRRPDFETDIAPKLAGATTEREKKIAAIRAMLDAYDSLVPRWKGVVWTAGAELEAEDEGIELPWANIKYSTTMYMGGVDDSDYYHQLMDYGIPAIGEYMDLETLAQYKYHLDIGGGGGTTWSGTFEKLAMPGVLFHHETPTMDYNHARIKPWVHYIPVEEELYDLKEKYEWAEAHPKEAQAISDRATELIKSLGTDDGFRDFFREFYVDPLRQVVDAYQPLEAGGSWRDFIREHRSDMRPMIKCDGYTTSYSPGANDDCENLSDHDLERRRQSVGDQMTVTV